MMRLELILLSLLSAAAGDAAVKFLLATEKKIVMVEAAAYRGGSAGLPQFNMRFVATPTILESFGRVNKMAFDQRNGLLFVNDQERGVMYREDISPQLSGRNYKNTMADAEPFLVNTNEVEGISVDWIANRVCYSDSDLGLIKCSRQDGRYPFILHRKNLEDELRHVVWRPYSFYIDPVKAALYVVTRDSEMVSSIEKLNGNGEVVAQVYTDDGARGNITDVISETGPLHNTRILWAAKFDGVVRFREEHSAGQYVQYNLTGIKKPVGIAACGDLFVIVGRDCKMKLGHYESPNAPTEIDGNGCISRDDETTIYTDVVSNQRSAQPDQAADGACSSISCRHHCLRLSPGPRSAVCRCAIGFELAGDGECRSKLLTRNFLLAADPYHKQIYQFSLETAEYSALQIPENLQNHPSMVAYSRKSAEVIWLDHSMTGDQKATTLNAFSLLTAQARTLATFPLLPRLGGLAVDESDGRIYYTRNDGLWSVDSQGKNTNLLDSFSTSSTVPLAFHQKQRIAFYVVNFELRAYQVNSTAKRRYPLNAEAKTLHVSEGDTLFVFFHSADTKFEIGASGSLKEVPGNDLRGVTAAATVNQLLYYFNVSKHGLRSTDLTANGPLRANGVHRTGKEIFSRITSLVYVDNVTANPHKGRDVSGKRPFPWVWVAPVLAGIFLLLLLICCCFCCCFCCRSPHGDAFSSEGKMVNSAEETSTFDNFQAPKQNASTGFDEVDVDKLKAKYSTAERKIHNRQQSGHNLPDVVDYEQPPPLPEKIDFRPKAKRSTVIARQIDRFRQSVYTIKRLNLNGKKNDEGTAIPLPSRPILHSPPTGFAPAAPFRPR